MARKASFKVTNTRRGWKVEIPASFSSNGERSRTFFKTRDEAKDAAARFRAQQENHGNAAALIRPALAEDALRAEILLEPYGISILEAARRVANMEEAARQSALVEAAFELFLSAKEGRSDSQEQAYSQLKAGMKEDFSGRPLSTISGAELLAHVEERTGTPSSFNRRAETLKTFWRWCSRAPRAWCDSKIIEVLEFKETIKGHTEVLSSGDCIKLMTAAEDHYPDCVPPFAIALFTGMRKAELARLEVCDVREDGIEVPALSAKTKRRRFIQMPAPLKVWLNAYPIGETVTPSNWVRKEKAVRRLAGWKVWADLLQQPEPPEDLPPWPDNALRHTHASVHIALGKPLDSLTFEFGHSGGANVLKSHYVGTMPKSEAAEIWALRPIVARMPLV
jgi:integrase